MGIRLGIGGLKIGQRSGTAAVPFDWSSYWATSNLVIEGHSFVYPVSTFADSILENVVASGFYNPAVGGETVPDLEARAATTDSHIVAEGSGNRNIMVLWIGVNGFYDNVGIGTTRYAEVKSYVDYRVAAGWKVFLYTMTPSTYTRSGIFESERTIFNNLLRNGWNNGKVFVLDTDTITELDDPTNTTYYTDTIHLTQYGYYLASQLLGAKIFEITGAYQTPSLSADTTDMTMTPTGTKADITVLTCNVDTPTVITIDGDGKFYKNSTGTLGELSQMVLAPGVNRAIYIKNIGSACNIKFNGHTINYFHWDSSSNGATIGGDVSQFSANLTHIYSDVATTLSGSITAFTLLTYINISNANSISGNITSLTELIALTLGSGNTLSGSIAALTKLITINVDANNTLTGSIAALVDLTTLIIKGSNTISGSIAALTKLTYIEVLGTNSISGSIANIINTTRLNVSGANTITGSLAGLTKLTYLTVLGSNTLTYGAHTWAANTIIYRVDPATGSGWSVADISQCVIDGAATTWTSTKQLTMTDADHDSMADTTQGGIWGDFSGDASPSTLATAYKTLMRTLTVTVALRGITAPGATGDGTGFPAGFGDWYRS